MALTVVMYDIALNKGHNGTVQKQCEPMLLNVSQPYVYVDDPTEPHDYEKIPETLGHPGIEFGMQKLTDSDNICKSGVVTHGQSSVHVDASNDHGYVIPVSDRIVNLYYLPFYFLNKISGWFKQLCE